MSAYSDFQNSHLHHRLIQVACHKAYTKVFVTELGSIVAVV